MLCDFEYCPKCGGIRSMGILISLKKVAAPGGGIKEVLVRNYHCETCSSYVYSVVDEQEEALEEAAEIAALAESRFKP
jgi:hypothetical protein